MRHAFLFAFLVMSCAPHAGAGDPVAVTVYETHCDGPGLTLEDCKREAARRCGGEFLVMGSTDEAGKRQLTYRCKNEPPAKTQDERDQMVLPVN